MIEASESPMIESTNLEPTKKEKKPRKSRKYYVAYPEKQPNGEAVWALESTTYTSHSRALDSLPGVGTYRILVQVDEVTVSEKTVKEIKR